MNTVKPSAKAIPSTKQQTNPKTADELKQEGNAHMGKGAYAKALDSYTKALELMNRDQEASPAANNTATNEDPPVASTPVVTPASTSNNSLLQIILSNRAAALFNLRRYRESLADADHALSLDPTYLKARKRKAISLLHLARFDEAIEVINQGLMISPGNEELLQAMDLARNMYDEALASYILPPPALLSRLDNAPVFIVADAQSQPFFITYEDGQQICTFYFDYKDAEATLDWIKQENPDLGAKASIIPLGLSQAFQLAKDTNTQNAPKLEAAIKAMNEARIAAEARGDPPPPPPENFPLTFQFRPELRQVEAAVEILNDPARLEAQQQIIQSQIAAATAATATDSAKKPKDDDVATIAPTDPAPATDNNQANTEEAKPTETENPNALALTVDNFNGIPIFQAKGLILLQETAQYIPLFFSKWDLMYAWDQLKISSSQLQQQQELRDKAATESADKPTADSANGPASTTTPPDVPRPITLPPNVPQLAIPGDVPDIDVGTLEDVLRRMAADPNSGEFDQVIFVPSRESLQHTGKEFPLDDFTKGKDEDGTIARKPFQAARQLKALGGSKEAIREAIKMDLVKNLDATKHKEIIERHNLTHLYAMLSQTQSLTQSPTATVTSHQPVGNPVQAAGQPVNVEPVKVDSSNETPDPVSVA